MPGWEKLQSTMSKIRAQHSTELVRQFFHRKDIPPPSLVAEPSSTHSVVTTDAQITALLQQMKVLIEVVQSLQKQQTQQQLPVEEPVAQSVPSRHNRHPPRCSPSSSPEWRPSQHSYRDGQLCSRHSHRATHHLQHSPSLSCVHSIRKEKRSRTPSASPSISSSGDSTPRVF